MIKLFGLLLVIVCVSVLISGCSKQSTVSEASPTPQTVSESPSSPTASAVESATSSAPGATESPSPPAPSQSESSTLSQAQPVSAAGVSLNNPTTCGSPAPNAPGANEPLHTVAQSPPPSGAVNPKHGHGQLTGYYFMVPEHHPDFGNGVDGLLPGLVGPCLGPHGYPVVTNLGRLGTQLSGHITDVNADGEILWWSTSSKHHIKADRVANESLPFDFEQATRELYPTGYQDDATYFQTAHFRGTFTTTAANATIGFTEGSDDDSWVFIDRKLAIDNGGTKQSTTAPYVVEHLSPGTHTLDIFYDDRFRSRAELVLSTDFPVVAFASTKPVASLIKKKSCTELLTMSADTLFEFGKAELSPAAQNTLAALGPTIKAAGTHPIRINGFTDSIGSDAYNVALSEQRARSVRDWLAAHGYVKASTPIQGFGKEDPVAPNTNPDGSDNPQGRARNRRVEVLIDTCR
jgi:fibro-slime domain-containing protein